MGHNACMSVEIHSREVTCAPAPSASVMLLRDGALGLEVLLVKRHGNSRVLGGVHVFPGGKLDAEDRTATGLDRPPAVLQQALAEPGLALDMAAGLHVAALRETFEEVGLLLHEGLQPGQTAELRARLSAGGRFHEACDQMGLVLQTRQLLPWSRWITPRMPSVSDRRFDTRFFVARAPTDHAPVLDAHEVTEAVWLRPKEALERYWAGELGLVPVQILTLVQLAAHAHVASALQQAAKNPPPLIEPEPFDVEGQRVICYPGDPAHPVRQPVWTGPTRLTWRNRRFEPEGGLAALLPAGL